MAFRRLLLRLLGVTASAAACTSEAIVMVEPAFVEVTPAEVSAIEGETVQLVGSVHDEQNHAVTGTPLEWSSSDTTVAKVDGRGLVTTRAPGGATIRARFEDVSGEANVEVLRGPFVVLVPTSLTLHMAPGAAPPQQVIAVSNGGAGRLEQMTASIAYEGGSASWLRASLAAAAAPTSLTLRVEPAGLVGGRYAARVSVAPTSTGGIDRANGAEVDVAVHVAGFEVRPTGGSTVVAESGTTDRIDVVLSSQPASAVVLLATVSDPTEVSVSPASLRFEPGTWDRAQAITVRGVDDIDDDGDQVSTVRIAVDGAQSPDAYDVLPARTVQVTTTDDDDPPGLVVVESEGSTVVSENNTIDAFTVALASAITTNVVLEITTTDASEVGVISSAYLTFTPANWNVPQTVSVIGIDDFLLDGDQFVTVTIRVLDAYSDDRYDTLFRNVTVQNVDNELFG